MRSVCIILLFLTYSVCYSQSKEPKSLFSNVNIVDVEAGKVLQGMDVLVKGSTIVEVNKHKKGIVKREKDVLFISSKGKYIVPGLTDCHTHPIYKEDISAYLRNGVTTIFTLGGPIDILKYREQVKKGLLDGPNIYAAAFMDTSAFDWEGVVYTKTIKSVADVVPRMDQIKSEGWDIIKAYNGLSTEEFDEIMRIAKLYGLPVVGHGIREPGMEYILSKGMGMVAHSEEYAYTMFKDSLDESKIAEAVAVTKKYGAFVCPNLSTFKIISDQWGDSLNFVRLINEPKGLKEQLNPSILNGWVNHNRYISSRKQGALTSMYSFLKKLTYAMYKANIPLVAGTDSPVIPGCFPGYSLVYDLQLLTEAGLTNVDALKTATMIPGQFIEKNIKNAFKVGLVKKGYQSDLLLLSENPLSDIQNLRDISGVMVKGKWYDRSRLDSLEVQEKK